jgi:hypothetical protein
MIFSDKGGVIVATKLCNGTLVQTKGNKRMHCALGEAFNTFINRNPRVLRSLINSAKDSATDTVINILADHAIMKNSTLKTELTYMLVRAVDSNDSCGLSCDKKTQCDIEYIIRAKTVASVFRDDIAPLLK